MSERDNVGASIACFDVTTLEYCDKCGYYEVGETYYESEALRDRLDAFEAKYRAFGGTLPDAEE